MFYSGTPLYGHPLNTDTRILRTVSFFPTQKSSYISLKLTRLIRTPVNADTLACPLGVRINRVSLYKKCVVVQSTAIQIWTFLKSLQSFTSIFCYSMTIAPLHEAVLTAVLRRLWVWKRRAKIWFTQTFYEAPTRVEGDKVNAQSINPSVSWNVFGIQNWDDAFFHEKVTLMTDMKLWLINHYPPSLGFVSYLWTGPNNLAERFSHLASFCLVSQCMKVLKGWSIWTHAATDLEFALSRSPLDSSSSHKQKH